jgi:hypothetical protein
MKDRYLVTLEIETYDGDPKEWYWDVKELRAANVTKVISSDFKGRVLPTNEGESE